MPVIPVLYVNGELVQKKIPVLWGRVPIYGYLGAEYVAECLIRIADP